MTSNLKLLYTKKRETANRYSERWVGTCVDRYRHHVSVPGKLWVRDILKRDYRRMYWHKHKHCSRGHTAAEALFQGELWAVHNTHAHTHKAINLQITSYYSCPHAQTRLSLVNYSQIRRDLAADRYPARVAESVTLQLLLYNPKHMQHWKHSSSAPHPSHMNTTSLNIVLLSL